ncbi:response regulator [Burkholderiaceae bacterium DAT-1]|nr:response regulator [Burkholderiaceae bacterium DAT-1]
MSDVVTRDVAEVECLPRVLVVDDSRIVRATIRKHLANMFEIVEEEDGIAGWERLVSDDQVFVLISDLTMPRLDGFGLLDRIRKSQDHRLKGIPVIIISGEEDADTKARAVDRGANDFITKSTDRTEMVSRVSAAVKLAKASRELQRLALAREQAPVLEVQSGLASRHLLELEASKSLASAKRHRGEVTLVLLALDGIDALKARLGEAPVAQLVSMIGQTLSGKLRKDETFALVDEAVFGLLLSCSINQCGSLSDRLLQTVTQARVTFRGERIQLSASVGVSNSRTDGGYDASALLVAAESRLSAAREAGGNQVKLPDISMAAMDIQTALSLLYEGKQELVTPHLPHLLSELAPLLQLAGLSAS